MINDFLDFTEFISWTIFSEPYIFCTGRTAVYHAVQSKSCTAFVPYKKNVVRPYISFRTSGYGSWEIQVMTLPLLANHGKLIQNFL